MSTTISIDVYCHKNWDSSPVYRIYVDDDLLTERTWQWPAYETYIKENIEVDVDSGTHRIYIENCSPNSNINFKNLTVNGQLISTEDQQESAFTA
jgi:hypothetical protein